MRPQIQLYCIEDERLQNLPSYLRYLRSLHEYKQLKLQEASSV
jgi:hypothetical protein